MAKKKENLNIQDNENIVNKKRKNTSSASQSTSVPTAPAPIPQKPKKEKKYKPGDLSRPMHKLIPIILCAVATFIAVSFIVGGSGAGVLGSSVGVLYGLFSGASFFIPPLLVCIGFMWRRDVRDKRSAGRIIMSAISIVVISVLFHLPTLAKTDSNFDIVALYNNGIEISGGGVVGGSIAILLNKIIGIWGIGIVTAVVCVIVAVFFFGVTPQKIADRIRRSLEKSREVKAKRSEEKAKYEAERNLETVEEEQTSAPTPPPTSTVITSNRRNFSPDNFYDEDDIAPIEPNPAPSAKRTPVRINDKMSRIEIMPDDEPTPAPRNLTKALTLKPTPEISDATATTIHDFERIATREPSPATAAPATPAQKADPADRTIEATALKNGVEYTKITPDMVSVKNVVGDGLDAGKFERARGYKFPPVDLLNLPVETASTDINTEIQSNADKLIDTLDSFKVQATISSVSRGPRITRYEIVPKSGIRVSTIANLVDDISMKLATAGIRIEAPIPGKAAVGVEVPNRKPTTVYFRDLVDTKEFRSSPEQTNVCLGADVAGAPVFCDIAKTPHLLVAGATGMGKSVCINTIITSILYKATPDEVKLILVDPKKVEFNVYRGVPHLLVPVVVDPKKAAGALSWAVNEMERRYDLIEEMGVRNIKGYNEAIKGTDKEFLPKIVIIIDELADLMLTARDSIEKSIQRITQKARAAGIHLIIGTQRPTTDVITGTIKANIPSRIAFHVSSQIDSRVVIETTGAEKLLNNGDMLFSFVGTPKPIRVQGAFIDDKEVDRVTNFMREHNKHENYNNDVIADIEREAKKCSSGGKKSGGIMEDGEADDDMKADPMLYNAIEVAVDCGKISTSLLQRKLSIGYGRAAKYIDYMASMGYVSEPDGNKPRETLITREEYQEMMMNNDNV